MDGAQLPAAHAVALMAGLPVRVVTGVGYKTEKVLAELGAEVDLFEPMFILKSINLPRQARDKTWGTLRGKTLSTGVQTISELREVVAAGGNDGGGQVRASQNRPLLRSTVLRKKRSFTNTGSGRISEHLSDFESKETAFETVLRSACRCRRSEACRYPGRGVLGA